MLPETIPALFLHAVTTFNKKDAFKHKLKGKWTDISHEEVLEAVRDTTRGIVASNLTRGDRIALISENRLEWAIADLAILAAGCVNVPVYSSLPSNQIEYILRDAETRAVFVSNKDQYAKIGPIRERLPNLSHVFVFDAIDDEPNAVPLGALMEKGRNSQDETSLEDRIATIDKNDWASVIYTSGTTGDPKGVVLTHWNFVSNVMSCTKAIDIGPSDRVLSWLPLSHVFERTAGYYTELYLGVTIAYAESLEKIPQYLSEVRPTAVISAPRLFEKMYARVFDTVTAGSAFKKNLFFWAVQVGKIHTKQKAHGRAGRVTRSKYRIAESMVFRKLKAKTGGNIRFFVSGGAPLAREIAEFFHAVGLPIFEGYGTTETSPVLAVNTFEHFKFGTVGRPIRDVEIRIADDGEILAKGPNVMYGYYKKPNLTKEAIVDGWYHTGDIGYLDADGYLVITDRKKDLIVTSGGKNVAPQPIEGLLKTSKYITEALLIGNNRKFVSAIIVPNFENVKEFADATGISYQDETDLVRHPEVTKKIADEIDSKSRHLAGFERVKKFLLLEKDFTIEDNELTPTLKVKRSKVEAKYEKEIDTLYEE